VSFIAVLKATMNNLPQIFIINARKQECSNCQLIVIKQVYSMTKIVSVTQYVFLIMLKSCNIHEFDYFVPSAGSLTTEPAHTLF